MVFWSSSLSLRPASFSITNLLPLSYIATMHMRAVNNRVLFLLSKRYRFHRTEILIYSKPNSLSPSRLPFGRSEKDKKKLNRRYIYCDDGKSRKNFYSNISMPKKSELMRRRTSPSWYPMSSSFGVPMVPAVGA